MLDIENSQFIVTNDTMASFIYKVLHPPYSKNLQNKRGRGGVSPSIGPAKTKQNSYKYQIL